MAGACANDRFHSVRVARQYKEILENVEQMCSFFATHVHAFVKPNPLPQKPCSGIITNSGILGMQNFLPLQHEKKKVSRYNLFVSVSIPP
jgi:hypothetical protein